MPAELVDIARNDEQTASGGLHAWRAATQFGMANAGVQAQQRHA